MTTVSIRRSDGDSVTLDSSAVESLKAELRGPLLSRETTATTRPAPYGTP